MRFILLIFLSLHLPTWADTLEVKNQTFAEAKMNRDFVRFDMASTKIGLFTSHFSGFVRNFKLEYQVGDHEVHDIKIQFLASDMDTDNGSRNAKMRAKCLNEKDFPQMEVQISQLLKVVEGEQKVAGVLLVRGQKKPIEMSISMHKESDSAWDIEGTSDLSLKDLEIPDPSISIASVDDHVRIHFRMLRVPGPTH